MFATFQSLRTAFEKHTSYYFTILLTLLLSHSFQYLRIVMHSWKNLKSTQMYWKTPTYWANDALLSSRDMKVVVYLHWGGLDDRNVLCFGYVSKRESHSCCESISSQLAKVRTFSDKLHAHDISTLDFCQTSRSGHQNSLRLKSVHILKFVFMRFRSLTQFW